MHSVSKVLSLVAVILAGCTGDDQAATPRQGQPQPEEQARAPSEAGETAFRFEAERFADARILRYRVPVFEVLDGKIASSKRYKRI